MAKILKDWIAKDPNFLKKLGINIPNSVNSLAELPMKLTGILAGIDHKLIRYDRFGNPFIKRDEARISLASVVISPERRVFTFNREGKILQNQTASIDVIGAVGFGLSSFFYKVPQELWGKSADISFKGYVAFEETDSDGDAKFVEMPTITIELKDVGNCEEYFVDPRKIDISRATSKVQAALLSLDLQD